MLYQDSLYTVFHLHNSRTGRELRFFLDGQPLKHDLQPTLLGVTLDRTLIFNEHFKKTAGKL